MDPDLLHMHVALTGMHMIIVEWQGYHLITSDHAEPGSSSGQQLAKGPKVKVKLTVKPSSKQPAEEEQEQLIPDAE